MSAEITTEAERELVSIAQLVLDEAKARCPVGPDRNEKGGFHKGGTLRDSLAIRIRHLSAYEPVAVVGTLVPYAVFVEFGKHKNPFLYRALMNKKDEVQARVKDAVARGITKGLVGVEVD